MNHGQIAARLVRGLAFFFDPVIFLSAFGPLLVTLSIRLLHGEVLSIAPSDGSSGWQEVLRNREMPGVVDYIIQLYTALLVWVFWTVRWWSSTVKHVALKVYSAESPTQTLVGADGREYLRSVIYTILGALLTLWAVSIFFFGGTANSDVVSIYIDHTKSFGQWRWPPLNSPLTWFRIAIAVFGVVLIVWPCKFVVKVVPMNEGKGT